jgi:hypothetical protein
MSSSSNALELAIVPVEPVISASLVEATDTQSSDLPAASAPPTDIPFGQSYCCFGCGPLFSIASEMTNIANSAYPKYSCHPCANARRCIENQCRKDPQMRDYLNQLKQRQPEEWKLRVRQCRVVLPGQKGPGLASVAQRREKILNWTEEIEVWVGMQDRM